MLWLTGGGFWINCVGPRLPGLGVDRAAKSIRQIANQERLRAIAFRPLSEIGRPMQSGPLAAWIYFAIEGPAHSALALFWQ